MSNRPNLVGQRFGLLTAIERAGTARDGHQTWRCRCDCGQAAVVATNHLRRGTRSCGHLVQEARLKHGHAIGGVWTPEYRSWLAMIQRCEDANQKNWHHYGGRGIRVCEEWRYDFLRFLAHIGHKPTPTHSLDRINVNGNYEPGNVRWATPREQANNRRAAHFNE